MTEEDIDRIRETWAKAVSAPDIVGRMFYDRLFRRAPEARKMFADDMTQQQVKLVDTLAFIVDHLDDPEPLMNAARDLAIRHVAYGVTPDQYPDVGGALIETLETALGSDFSEADKAAWVAAYTGLSDAMIDAAYPAAQPS